MISKYPFKDAFIRNLIEVNERALVDKDILEIVSAYARLRLDSKEEVSFYDDSLSLKLKTKNKRIKKLIEKFITKNRHLDRRIQKFLVSYAEEMARRNARFILSPSHLAHLLQIPEGAINGLAFSKEKHYTKFQINKRDGSKRDIYSPKPNLKRVQRWLLAEILRKVKLHPRATGFRRKRSILTNARKHLRKKVVIKMDLKDFFPSISFNRVRGIFSSLGYPDQVALLLANLTTFKERLPIGAPTSPALSNILCRRLDYRFSNLGKKLKFSYSRYADDITISSNKRDITRRIPFFKQIIQEEGFQVNEKKLTILRKGNRQKVTGVVVNRKPNIARKEIKKLRAIIHNCKTKDIRKERTKWAVKEKKIKIPMLLSMGAFKESLRGHINFVRMVNPKAGNKLLREFNSIAWRV